MLPYVKLNHTVFSINFCLIWKGNFRLAAYISKDTRPLFRDLLDESFISSSARFKS